MQKLAARLLSVHASTSSALAPSPQSCSPRHFLVLRTMDKLMNEICREKLIVERCKKSIDMKEPYDLISMKQQIDISMSKITSMKMRLFHMQNNNFGANSTSNIKQQIYNTQRMCHGAKKVHASLIKEEHPNEKVLRETEQAILVLNEKLELLIQCASTRGVPQGTPISVRRSRDSSQKRNLPVQVSGLLKIRVTGLSGLPEDTKPRKGRYASEYLSQMVKKKTSSMFRRHSFRRSNHRGGEANDYIVMLHVGGKEVAMVVWNEKKTMVIGDEEAVQLHKSRQLDFEVYHTDSRSLCAIGTMQLEALLDEHDAKYPFASFAHRIVDLIPQGTLHFQTTYSDPEQSMEQRLGETQDDGGGGIRNSISVRRNGLILARDTQRGFRSRPLLSENQFLPATPSARPRRINSLESYRLQAVIGVGAFGTVQLAQRVDDDQYWAIKIIQRDPRTRSFDTPELQILNNIHHPFICSLMASFIENDALHLVLEFCEAGDLHTHLSRTAHGFNRASVTFFAASIVLAVEYLHEKLYVHRDLKTENMMLTRQGVLKIIDFGLCKKLKTRREKMCDIVGTTTHLAAEIHRREPYGIEMDWWAVGVSLYQLRTREQPFYGTREVEMEANSRVDKWYTFQDLLISLMSRHPEARLGYYCTDDVKKHPFFMDTDFDAVLNSTTPPPYTPFLREGLDLEYFDHPYHSELDTSSSSFSSVSSFVDYTDLTI